MTLPHRLAVPGCCALPGGGPGGQPLACAAAPTVAGLLDARRPGRAREVWLAFACDAHAGQVGLVAARPLLDRDRAVLAAWRVEAARWALPPGHPDRPGPHGRPADPPRPLAVGDAAVELLRRARRAAVTDP